MFIYFFVECEFFLLNSVTPNPNLVFYNFYAWVTIAAVKLNISILLYSLLES